MKANLLQWPRTQGRQNGDAKNEDAASNTREVEMETIMLVAFSYTLLNDTRLLASKPSDPVSTHLI